MLQARKQYEGRPPNDKHYTAHKLSRGPFANALKRIQNTEIDEGTNKEVQAHSPNLIRFHWHSKKAEILAYYSDYDNLMSLEKRGGTRNIHHPL